MQRLEEQLGRTLLHRTGSGVRLTRAGESLVAHAETLLAQHDDMVMELSGASLRGSVSLGCTEDYASAFLPDLLGSFCATFPDVDLRLVCAPSTDLRPLLHQRQARHGARLPALARYGRGDPHRTAGPGLPMRRCRTYWTPHSCRWHWPRPQHSITGRPAPQWMQSTNAIGWPMPATALPGFWRLPRSGHALSVLTQSAVPDDLCIVTDKLPSLPAIGITLEVADQRSSAAATGAG